MGWWPARWAAFIPGTLSGDGHPVDAYLLGWSEPLAEAAGVIAAVLVRADDVEDKLVVIRPGSEWSDAQIMKAARFQERDSGVRLVR